MVDYPIHAIKRVIYDGKTIPFTDNKFTVTLVSFVLHHIPKSQQKTILQDLKRITKNKIIIIEDLFPPTIGRWWLYAVEYILNRLYSSKVPIPFAFRTPAQWRGLFTSAGLVIVNQKVVKSPTPFLKHIVFTVKENN